MKIQQGDSSFVRDTFPCELAVVDVPLKRDYNKGDTIVRHVGLKGFYHNLEAICECQHLFIRITSSLGSGTMPVENLRSAARIIIQFATSFPTDQTRTVWIKQWRQGQDNDEEDENAEMRLVCRENSQEIERVSETETDISSEDVVQFPANLDEVSDDSSHETHEPAEPMDTVNLTESGCLPPTTLAPTRILPPAHFSEASDADRTFEAAYQSKNDMLRDCNRFRVCIFLEKAVAAKTK